MMPLAQISVQIWMIIDYNITTVSKAILILQLVLRMGMSVWVTENQDTWNATVCIPVDSGKPELSHMDKQLPYQNANLLT